MVNIAPLADPTRQRIIEMLAERERSSGEIAHCFHISAPAISQHLALLKASGFVRSRVEGQRRIYQLDAAGFHEIEQWLAGIKQFWEGRLDSLERELRTAAPARRGKRSLRKKGR